MRGDTSDPKKREATTNIFSNPSAFNLSETAVVGIRFTEENKFRFNNSGRYPENAYGLTQDLYALTQGIHEVAPDLPIDLVSHSSASGMLTGALSVGNGREYVGGSRETIQSLYGEVRSVTIASFTKPTAEAASSHSRFVTPEDNTSVIFTWGSDEGSKKPGGGTLNTLGIPNDLRVTIREANHGQNLEQTIREFELLPVK